MICHGGAKRKLPANLVWFSAPYLKMYFFLLKQNLCFERWYREKPSDDRRNETFKNRITVMDYLTTTKNDNTRWKNKNKMLAYLSWNNTKVKLS